MSKQYDFSKFASDAGREDQLVKARQGFKIYRIGGANYHDEWQVDTPEGETFRFDSLPQADGFIDRKLK